MSLDLENEFSLLASNWARTLCVLERLEIIVDDYNDRTTLQHDVHKDKKNPDESEDQLKGEFDIQISTLKRSWQNVENKLHILINDLFEWYAGREVNNIENSIVDNLSKCLYKSLKEKKVDSSNSGESKNDENKNKDSNEKENILGGNVSPVKSKFSHKRGAKSKGVQRFNKLFNNMIGEDFNKDERLQEHEDFNHKKNDKEKKKNNQ